MSLRSVAFVSGSWLFVAFAVGLTAPGGLRAQKLEVRTLDADAGLASQQVWGLAQDDLGRLWIATGAGLGLYDGRRIQTFGVAQGLEWSDQAAVGLDARGQPVSVASRPPFPVYGRVGERFEPLPAMPVGEEAGQVIGFAAPAGSAGELAVATRHSVLAFDGAAWRRWTAADGLPEAEVTGLARWRDRLVVSTSAGLAMIRRGVVDLSIDDRLASGPGTDIRALAADGERLWVVGRDWVGEMNERGWTARTRVPDLGLPAAPDGGSVGAAADGLGGLYLVAGGELRYLDEHHRVERLDTWRGLEVGAVSAVLVDREGQLWVGGDRGLIQVRDRRFSSLREADGLLDEAVTALHHRSDDSLVIGHRGGVSWLDAEGARARGLLLDLGKTAGGRDEQVQGFAEDGSGGLWLAGASRGLGHLDAAGAERWWGTGAGLVGVVTSVLRDAEGRLWVGTEQGLYQRLGEGRFVKIRALTPATTPAAGRGASTADGLHVRALAQAADGSILIATRSGLHAYRFEADDWRSWRCERPSCNSTFGVAPDPLGHWVATAAGLYRAPPSGETLTQSIAPWVNEPVFFVVRGAARLYLGTENGVLLASAGVDRVERLTVENGLAGRETSRAAAVADALGRLWVGTDQGLSRYDPRFERPAPPPVVRLVEVTVDGRSYDLNQPLELPHDFQEAVFTWSAVTLSGGHSLRFRSWLEGGETGWMAPYASEAQELRLGRLRPGEYRFHHQAAVLPGPWSDTVTSAPLRVQAPFWRRGWFLALAAFFLMGGLYVVPSFVSQSRQARRLEGEVARRTAELQVSEDRYRKTFRTIEDGVLTTDEEGRVALLNPGAEAVTGWSEAAAVGRPVEEVLRVFQNRRGPQSELVDETGTLMPLMSGNLRDTTGPTQSAVLENRRGERRQVELTAAPILSGGGFAGLVFVFRDISGKKLIEAELARAQKLEAVGILAGGIAHDFNNLLTVLLGNLSLLQDSGRLGEDDAGLVGDAETALMRARDLTHQLLTFSRGGAPVREAASISEVIRDSASFVLAGSKVRSAYDLAPDLWVVEIDAGQISQVLNNLLINASQAMPSGGTIRLIGRNVSKGPEPLGRGRFVRIDVVDQGIGIAEADLERIFDPYFSTKDEGRGLGLASAYSIIKNHEGLLTVDSEEGKGTSFHIFLPASDGNSTPRRRAAESSFQGRGRVLIMDDDEVVRRTSGAMLERLGFDVDFSREGRQAIARYQDAMAAGERYDVVMMDLTVPGGMGGQEAMSRLREIDPRVCAIVYSGYSNDPVLANHVEYGFAGRLSKPFKLRELRRVLETILSER